MKKLILLILMLSFCSVLFANPRMGQRYYIKYMRQETGIKGSEFSIQHTKAEWLNLKRNGAKAFITEYSAKYPKVKPFLESDRFKRLSRHLFDFFIEYAADSGKIPTCK